MGTESLPTLAAANSVNSMGSPREEYTGKTQPPAVPSSRANKRTPKLAFKDISAVATLPSVSSGGDASVLPSPPEETDFQGEDQQTNTQASDVAPLDLEGT